MTTYNKGDIVIVPFPKRFSFTGKCLNRIFRFEKNEIKRQLSITIKNLSIRVTCRADN